MKENTNVIDLRYGQDACEGLGKEIGKFCVMTMDIPWKVSKDKLGGTPLEVVFIETMEEKWLDQMCDKLTDCDTVVGIGGGMAIDAAKYVSWKKGWRLVSIPTILSVDAFTTPSVGIRRNHEVVYIGQSSPNPLVIDFGIIRTAPPELNIAGIGDLLSMHTERTINFLIRTNLTNSGPISRFLHQHPLLKQRFVGRLYDQILSIDQIIILGNARHFLKITGNRRVMQLILESRTLNTQRIHLKLLGIHRILHLFDFVFTVRFAPFV